jgi:hypothetical protein
MNVSTRGKYKENAELTFFGKNERLNLIETENKAAREMRINISRKIRGYLFHICSNREHRGGENYGDI